MSRFWRGLAVILTALAFGFGSGAAEDGIGRIKTISGKVTVSRGGADVPVALGMSLMQSDVVTTAADGKVGMTFADNSMISLGPNSVLGLDKFRFDTTTYEGEFDSSLKKGTLAAVSGRISKTTPEAMKVRTPSAILGVRGTKFVVQVGGG